LGGPRKKSTTLSSVPAGQVNGSFLKQNDKTEKRGRGEGRGAQILRFLLKNFLERPAIRNRSSQKGDYRRVKKVLQKYTGQKTLITLRRTQTQKGVGKRGGRKCKFCQKRKGGPHSVNRRKLPGGSGPREEKTNRWGIGECNVNPC